MQLKEFGGSGVLDRGSIGERMGGLDVELSYP